MYNFKDTIDNTNGITALSSEAVSLDGEYIENNVPGYRTLSVSGRETMDYDITDENRPIGMDGTEYYGKRQVARILTIKFSLTGATAYQFAQRYRTLKNFTRGENRKIRFADEPNAHYTGTIMTMDPPEAGRLSVVSEMSFYCADPYLVSDIITTVPAAVEGGKLVAHIDNQSSGNIYPVYRIKHTAENGYIGIVHAHGAFEMGNIEEADGETYQRGEILFDTRGGSFAGWEDFTSTNSHPQNNKIFCNGSLKVADHHRLAGDTEATYKVLTLNNPGVDAAGCDAYGGCKRITLPPDSNGEVGAKNFYLWFQSQFATGALGQTGHNQVTFADENNKLICAFATSKIDKTGNTGYARFYLGDGNGGSSVYKTHFFTPTVYFPQNAFSYKGYEDMRKIGGNIRFYYYGTYFEIDVPALANKKVKYVYVFVGQHHGCPNRVTVMNTGKIFGQKLNVDKWRDLPNRYDDKAEAVINCENDTITVNGLPRNEELVTGSAFYSLPPGETKVEFYASSWCQNLPEVAVEYRERWL